MTKKVKMPQQVVMRHLENHLEIVYIDGALANLRCHNLPKNEINCPSVGCSVFLSLST